MIWLYVNTVVPLNFYSGGLPETDTDIEEMDTGNDSEVNLKGTKRKDPPLVLHDSSEDEDEDEDPNGDDLVDDLMQRNRETEQQNRELEMKLKTVCCLQSHIMFRRNI